MDVESYESLFKRLKHSFDYSSDLEGKAFLSSHISSALDECNSCISKGLDIAVKLLQETHISVNKLCEYIDNAITLLKMLSDYIKNVLESAAMACCNIKLFPTTTGNIILTVFTHCKESELIYGNNLKCVERQLKDLFRTCHELQLTYLMALEKHFIFDLSETEEQDILIEALNINMRIGEIAQALDIKTMAEQWKAYTVICEKYSSFLQDKNIYNKCSKLLATIIMDNIKIAMESDQESKSIIRSLKVANFTIKILSKISNMFKHSIMNNYEHIVELMEYIYLHNPSNLELSTERSQQLINLTVTNILNPTDALCNILLQDERFLDCVYKIDVQKLEKDMFLGYVILITTIIRSIVQHKEGEVLNVAKLKLIYCAYIILPLGHYWFNLEMKFHSKDGSDNYGLYEHLLVHMVAFALTFGSQEYAILEKYMYEGILSLDCYSALFSANLWTILIRISNDQLASNTLSSLLNVYQRLEKQKSFHNSPQRIHLSHLIEKLCQLSSSEDKSLTYKQIVPQNALWSVVKLPAAAHRLVEAEVLENLKFSYQQLFESEDVNEDIFDNLVQIMKIAASYTFLETSEVIEAYVVKLWSKLCHKNEYIRTKDLSTLDTVWCFTYLDALVSLTQHLGARLNSASSVKILHNMSTLLNNSNADIIALFFDLFCDLTFNRDDDENGQVIYNIYKETLEVLQQSKDICIKNHVVNILSKYRYNKKFEELNEITSTLLCKHESLMKGLSNSVEWKQQLLAVGNLGYVHRCVRIRTDDWTDHSEQVIGSTKSNFDLGDFLFEDEFEEPSRKKAKLDNNEVDSLVDRLENDVSLLCQVEGAALHSYKKRITAVIDKLRNILY